MENTSTSLFEVKNIEKLNGSNFLSWQRSIIATLDMRNIKSFLEETTIEDKEDGGIKRQRQMVYYFIIGHLDSENYNKFVVDEDKHPGRLWKTIKQHYESTLAENIATHFGKLFSIKFPSSSSGLSEPISSFRSTIKLLHSLSPQLFMGDIMPQVLAFYVLCMLPKPCRHVSTSVFHAIKVTTKIPTVEEVFREVELNIVRCVDNEDESNLALKVSAKSKKQLCSKGKHNPLAPHSEQECFQLYPEKHDAYHRRRNNQKVGTALSVCNLMASEEKHLAANGSDLDVLAEGTFQVATTEGNLKISNTLLVPSATSTLIAMGPFLNEGAVLRGYTRGADLFNKEGKLLLKTWLVNNMSVIDTAKIKAIVSDNGGEFINNEFLRLFEENGIIHLPIAPYTPQQNPVAERANRSLLERIRVLLLDYQVPEEWWGEACSMETYLLNQTPVSSLSFQTPISKWVATSPSTGIHCLHPFGCTSVINLPKERQTSKVSPMGILCMFLGNVAGHYNFRLYDSESRRILITHNCTFKDGEAFWPFYSSSLPLPSLSSLSLPADLSIEYMSGASELISDPEVEALLDEGEGQSPEAVIVCPPQPVKKPLPKGWTYKPVAETAPKDVTGVVSMEHVVSGKRSRQPPNGFAGVVVGMVPCSFGEAMASLKSNAWLNAIAREFASLEQHQVVKEVRRGKNQWLLDTTWFFRKKTNTEGKVTEEKEHLCVKGFRQIEDVDFHETFSPTGWLATLRFLLGYCASNKFDIQQMDVKTAFLHGDLEKGIFMKIPEGYTPTMEGEIFLKLTNRFMGSSKAQETGIFASNGSFQRLVFFHQLLIPAF
ncbi:hypothetical protein O181_018533 [Austropuccinia psidii MF-1]|uniref:Integrase catalytic domain-containing protein n=1 Tax=Austropuccinia psidii MF-1 TaxID=1389203 RepID=A0A9Q3C821_9BASI|nr:hypothetical protein [Austropuccinia psidii MF-1]